jgi:hypothetical protein
MLSGNGAADEVIFPEVLVEILQPNSDQESKNDYARDSKIRISM